MAKRIKSKKYTGIYYRELEDGDKVFEFTYKTIDGKKKWVKSIDLGAVVLRDIFSLRYPVNSKVIKSLRVYIMEKLETLPKEAVEEIVITGGSASLLGALDLKLTRYI